MAFKRDKREEEFMERSGATFRYTNKVTFQDLHHQWNVTNNGRERAKDDDSILEYMMRVEQGEVPPAPILARDEITKLFEVIDGVQRLCAQLELGTTVFSAYIVESDSPLLLKQMRITASRDLGGNPPTAKWNLAQAVRLLIMDDNMSVEEVARLLHRKPAVVQDEYDYQQTMFQVRTIGGPHELNKGLVKTLRKHANAEDFVKARTPVAEFLHSLKKSGFNNGESEPLVKRFFDVKRKGKNLHDEFNKKLGQHMQDPEVKTRLEGRPKSRLAGPIKLRRELRAALTVAEEVRASGERVTHLEEFYRLLNQIEKEIKQMDRRHTTT